MEMWARRYGKRATNGLQLAKCFATTEAFELEEIHEAAIVAADVDGVRLRHANGVVGIACAAQFNNAACSGERAQMIGEFHPMPPNQLAIAASRDWHSRIAAARS